MMKYSLLLTGFLLEKHFFSQFRQEYGTVCVEYYQTKKIPRFSAAEERRRHEPNGQ